MKTACSGIPAGCSGLHPATTMPGNDRHSGTVLAREALLEAAAPGSQAVDADSAAQAAPTQATIPVEVSSVPASMMNCTGSAVSA